jgi:hypothetical protein
MRIYNGFEALLIVAGFYAVFMFVFPFLIIGKLNTIIRNQNYLVRHFEIVTVKLKNKTDNVIEENKSI